MIIIYRAAQLRLAGYTGDSWTCSMDMAAKAIDVLSFCKDLDPVARKFAASLTLHYECLQGVSGSPILADTVLPQSSEYLFNKSPASAHLHDTSSQLFEKLCNPYADEGAMAARLNSNTHTRSRPSESSQSQWQPTEGSIPAVNDEKQACITPHISNLEDGYFVGASEPSWWLAARSSAAYSFGAKSLKVL